MTYTALEPKELRGDDSIPSQSLYTWCSLRKGSNCATEGDIHTHTKIHTHACMRARTHARMHASTHTHTHTHTHTLTEGECGGPEKSLRVWWACREWSHIAYNNILEEAEEGGRVKGTLSQRNQRFSVVSCCGPRAICALNPCRVLHGRPSNVKRYNKHLRLLHSW